jgi:hypothetical protein
MGERITQLPVEVLIEPSTTKARLTQFPVEILISPTTTKARVTQLIVEVLIAEGAPPVAGRKYGPAIQMM